MGEGLFATAPIAKGEFVIEYTGVHIPSLYADTLDDNRYLFEIDKKWTIDGSGLENTARYVNHSCDPNAEAVIEDGRVMYYAVRPIGKGEELTIDYGQEYFDDFIGPHGCRCGAAKHRKVRAKKA